MEITNLFTSELELIRYLINVQNAFMGYGRGFRFYQGCFIIDDDHLQTHKYDIKQDKETNRFHFIAQLPILMPNDSIIKISENGNYVTLSLYDTEGRRLFTLRSDL